MFTWITHRTIYKIPCMKNEMRSSMRIEIDFIRFYLDFRAEMSIFVTRLESVARFFLFYHSFCPYFEFFLTVFCFLL